MEKAPYGLVTLLADLHSRLCNGNTCNMLVQQDLTLKVEVFSLFTIAYLKQQFTAIYGVESTWTTAEAIE